MANQTIEKELCCGNKFQTEVMKILGFGLHNKTILVIRDFISAKYYARKNRVIYLTDNTKLYEKFKNAVNNDLCGHDDNCILINNWKNKLQFNISKMLEKFNMPKFDVAIMNPPYDGNLHLKILEKVISVADKVVNISPIRWLQDPLAKYKKNSDYNKFENSISKKIDDIEIVNGITATNLFGADFVSDLAIYTLSTGEFDYKCFNNNSIVDKVVTDKCKKLINVLEYKKQDGWRVRVQEMKPIPNNIDKNTIGYKTMKYFLTHSKLSWVYKDGYQNNIHWSKNTLSNGTGRKTFTNKDILSESIKFDTEIEAKNFENSTKTMFYKYIFSTMKIDSHTPFKFLPYMPDYTQPWTDKRFCEYFGITGYIDDEHAEPNSEWEIILNTMKDLK